jgi:pimeloyl-ACP methyl ester carboxylesterase
MIFKEFGNSKNPTIILIHGGGLSWWMWKTQIEVLSKDYCVVTPILDGHGDDFKTDFVSIEESAEKVINYIKKNQNGKVFAIGGLSIGAQIVVEILSQESEITKFAVIESALVYPIKTITVFTVPMFNLFYGLIKIKWYARLQAKTLNIPPELFDFYFNDSSRMSKKSLINMTISNGNFSMSQKIENSTAKTLILVGEKELPIMKKSAVKLSKTIKHSTLKILPKYSHGEISISNPREYIELCKSHFCRVL